MDIDWNHNHLRLAADPLAVARQAQSLPPIALCLLRLLDGHKTVRDTLRMSPVDEETARAVLRRLTELGLARPVGAVEALPETRVEGMSAPLRAWLATPRGARPSAPAGACTTGAADPGEVSDLQPLDDLLAELTSALQDPVIDPPGAPAPPAVAPRAVTAASPPTPPVEPAPELAPEPAPPVSRTPSSLHEALACHLAPGTGGVAFDDSDLAFFDSYVPDDPMTDTFSDLVSRPRRP